MFKYLNFIMDSVRAGPQVRDHFWFFFSILLPAGISFYTFEIVSYSLDVADGKIKAERDLLRFTSFATFFPHLIAGPIMRYADLRQQLQALQINADSQAKRRFRVEVVVDRPILQIFVADVCGTKVARSVPSLEHLTAIDQLTGGNREAAPAARKRGVEAAVPVVRLADVERV